MENVLGIIAEYNPFHNGHKYQLNLAKKITGADYTIAIISGNFTQRGNCSLISKWEKAKMAIMNGIDLVLELPTLYSISSAEIFAYQSIHILNSLNLVNFISFGVETLDLEILDKIAKVLIEEPLEFKKYLNQNLNMGNSFPKSREQAIIHYLKLDASIASQILSSPNNILAIEYLKSLKKLNSTIKPILIERKNTDYHSLTMNHHFASATGIRNMVFNNQLENIKKVIPQSSFKILENCIKNGELVKDISIFSNIIIYKLRTMSIQEIKNLPDVSEGLEYTIQKAANNTNHYEELISFIKSKRYTRTRINRILLSVLLGITKEDFTSALSNPTFIRVLGFSEKGKELLSKIHKQNPSLEIITSVKKYLNTNLENNLLNLDIKASNIYTLGYQNNSKSNLDFTKHIKF